MVRRVVITTALALLTTPAMADPRILRVATVAPAGSAWAREILGWARDVEHDSNDEVRIKMYFGASFGGEDEMESNLRSGRLDGAVSGGMLCSRAAPSLRVLRVLGLTRDRAEAIHLIDRLWPKLEREFADHGFVGLGVAIVGIDLLFSRLPVRSLADMRAGRYWIWDLDDVVQKQMTALGVHLVKAPLWDAAALYAAGKV
ncbi:MAG: TRAP transporter substrate-binding protein DctP, partial [Actinomycetota bacterium]